MNGIAYSTDGRSFAFEAELGQRLPVGGFVALRLQDGRVLLGQILDASVEGTGGRASAATERYLAGRGVLLSELADDGVAAIVGDEPFADASIEPATPESVSQFSLSTLGSTAGLELGEVQGLDGVTARLHANGFGRHTFLCGQSGSGKTYTLGVLLERLLMQTDARIVVLDPNSDFVKLGAMQPKEATRLSDEEYARLRSAYESVASKVFVFGGEDSDLRLKARFGNLSLQQQTMVLGLDPLADAEDYNAFLRIVRQLGGSDYSLEDVLQLVRASFDDGARRLGLRIDNLGIADQTIWAGESEPTLAGVPDDWRMLVADIGSLASSVESSIASAGFLGFLWEQRHNRQPVIIVIDEAHNVCPADPVDANQALATEHVIRIAGEGRKYGLYLLLSTQRPAKVHRNALSQCDNLLLMKMNSAADIADLAQTFSFAPRALIEQATGFGLGEGLAVGKIAPTPFLFRSGQRLTAEGGSDVPSNWADAR